MNKGLKLFRLGFSSESWKPRKRNTDLMNKGLKQEGLLFCLQQEFLQKKH